MVKRREAKKKKPEPKEKLYPTRYMIIRPHMVGEILTVDWPKKPGLDAIRAIVEPILAQGGGDHTSMEHANVLADFEPKGTKFKVLDMFMDDRGMVKGLHRNEVATAHYRRANQMGKTAAPKAADPEMLHAIFGTVVLFERVVWT